MSLWWMLGVGSGDAPTGVAARNAPSLCDAGVVVGDPVGPYGDGTDAYAQFASAQTGRSGTPDLCVAIAGGLVLDQLQGASWGLGRDDWLSTLTPTSASLSFVDEPEASPDDNVVVSLMSDLAAWSSDALWVGRVDGTHVDRTVERVATSIAATDLVGALGKAESPASIPAGGTLATLVESLAAGAGVALRVETDPLVTLPALTGASDLSGKVIDLVNRIERSSNALLFQRAGGRLRAAMRDATGATSARVVELDGADSPGTWSEDLSLDGVVSRWVLGDGALWSTDTPATTAARYPDHTFSATDLLLADPAPYAALISSDVLANPRPLPAAEGFVVRDLSQAILYVSPLDRVSYDGAAYQVMGVRHEVAPLRLEDGSTVADWHVSLTADATQEALVGAPEPGPVTPPALHTVTQTYVATKAATAELEADGDRVGTGSGPLLAGRYRANGSRYRSAVEWAVAPPPNAIRVVSAKVRLRTGGATDAGRLSLRRCTDDWSEGDMRWPGPHTSTTGERFVSVPSAGNRTVWASISAIAQGWFASGNHGLRIAASDEDAFRRFCTLWSDDAGDPDDRPFLSITWEVVS